MPNVPLSQIAHGRSGDKGNHANVAIIAYTDAGFAWLRDNLTADVVAKYFAPLGACAETLPHDATCADVPPRLWAEGRVKTYELKPPMAA